MYTKVTTPALFLDGNFVRVYKDGNLRGYKTPSCPIFTLVNTTTSDVNISRAQAYRYWEKHFADLPCYCLPEVLQEALEKVPTYEGYYFDRKGELVCTVG